MFDYVNQAIKTESLELTKFEHPRLLHAVIGINTEVAEVLLAVEGDITNVKEEFGDLLWYCAIVADVYEITFAELATLSQDEKVEDDPVKALLFFASEAMDHMKKVSFYGIEVDDAFIGKCFGSIIYAVKILAKDEGWELSDLQEANIAKLRARYGEKFTTEAAVNRNKVAEMEAVGS